MQVVLFCECPSLRLGSLPSAPVYANSTKHCIYPQTTHQIIFNETHFNLIISSH